jgi:hypothetical protein
MAAKKPKRSTDVNERAFQIVAEAVGDTEPAPEADDGKNPAAVALGRKGGQRGGKARAERMTAEERSDSARRAAQARWSNRD